MNHHRNLHLVFGLILGIATPAAQAATFIVSPPQSIQAAIDAANPGDTVLVNPGIYLENIDFKGKAITVRSTGGAKNTILDGSSIPSQVVVFQNGEGNDSVLEGFTILRGNANSTSAHDSSGGGIACLGASPTIRKNVIRCNSAEATGGGIYCGPNSNPRIEYNIIGDTGDGDDATIPCFISNIASQGGGGIACKGPNSAPVIHGNIIARSEIGGGILSDNASPKITENMIFGNLRGSGIALLNGGSPVVDRNRIFENDFTNFSMYGELEKRGGGILCANTKAEISNNLIHGNKAALGGGVFFFNDVATSPLPLPTFVNNTVYGNSASYESYGEGGIGGGISAEVNVDYLDVSNSVVWGNQATVTGTEELGNEDDFYLDHCLIGVDPLFVGASLGDFHLLPASPCIDQGNPSALGLPNKDFDGSERVHGVGVDIGADEFSPMLYVMSSPKVVSTSFSFEIKVVGTPGDDILLYGGFGLNATPFQSLKFGDFYLTSLLLFGMHLGTVPATGVATLAAGNAPYTNSHVVPFHLQAALGSIATHTGQFTAVSTTLVQP